MMALAFLFEEPRNELDLATPWQEWDMGLYQRLEEDYDMGEGGEYSKVTSGIY